MTREAKVGLMMVAVLVGVFGFLLYKRVHRPAEALAEQEVRDNSAVVAEEVSQPLFEEERRPARKKPRVVRDAEKVVEDVEQVAADVIEEIDPFPAKKKKAKKPALPVELPSDEDEFGQFQQPARPVEKPRKPDPIEPAEDAFGDFSEPRLKPPEDNRVAMDNSESDPFANELEPPKGRANEKPDRERREPVEEPRRDRFEQARRDRTEDTSRNRNDRFQPSTNRRVIPEESRVDPVGFQDESPAEDSRRPREFDNGFDQPQRDRRRAAPTALADEGQSLDVGYRGNGADGGRTYTVQPNDNFWTISRARYGAGRYYMALAMHNRQVISDPKMMKPGVTISTPDVAELERRYADVIPKAAPADSGTIMTASQTRPHVEAGPAGYFVSPEGEPMYRVGEQDTLTGIAKSHLGRTTRWVQILEMNRNVLRDGNELRIGTVLRLPADASRVQIVGSPREYR